jgi:hypothetical protein
MAKWNFWKMEFWLDPNWEEASFKKVAEGWVMPGSWPFARTSYLLNDNQKAEINACIRRSFEWSRWERYAFQVVTFIFFAMLMLPFFVAPGTKFGLGLVVLMAVALLISSLVWLAVALWRCIRHWQELRALLVGLTRTNRQITFVERYRMRAMAWSREFLILAFLISIAFLLFGAYVAVTSASDFWFGLVFVASSASMLIFSAVMVAIRFKISREQLLW